MGLRFPDLKVLGPLSEVEWQALRSLGRACVDVCAEWDIACTASAGLVTRLDLVEDYAGQGPFLHHVVAVREVWRQASVHERRMGEIAWRYVSAAVVLGAEVLDRLLAGRAALSAELVDHLAGHEATLDALSAACDGTYARLIAARNDDRFGTEGDSRKQLLALLDRAYSNVAHMQGDGRVLTREEASQWQLIAASKEDTDPLWEDLLTPMLDYAENLLFQIAYRIDHHGGSPQA